MKHIGKISLALWAVTLATAAVVAKVSPDVFSRKAEAVQTDPQAPKPQAKAAPVAVQYQGKVDYPDSGLKYPWWRTGYQDTATMDPHHMAACAPSTYPPNFDPQTGLKACVVTDGDNMYSFIYTGQRLKFDARGRARVTLTYKYHDGHLVVKEFEAFPKVGDDTVLSISTTQDSMYMGLRMVDTEGLNVAYTLANGRQATLYFAWPQLGNAEVYKWDGSL